MKAAVSAYGKDLDAGINPRFGRCDYLLIVDTQDMSFEAFANENKDLSGGAGIQTATFVISKGAACVLTGECGPNAMEVFRSSSVHVYTGQTGTVGEAVRRLEEGILPAPAGAAERPGTGAAGPGNMKPAAAGGSQRPAPMGGCGGRGMGGGGGRGMGGGRGLGGGCGMGRRGRF